MSTRSTLGQCPHNWAVLSHWDTAPLVALLSIFGSFPSWQNWFEVCAPAAAVIAHRSACLRHKGTPPQSWLTLHWRPRGKDCVRRPIKATPSKALLPPGAQRNEEAQGEGNGFSRGTLRDDFEHVQELPTETHVVSAGGGQWGSMAWLRAWGVLPLNAICSVCHP